MGVVVIVIAFLGFFGVAIESRGLLKLLMFFVGTFSVLLTTFGFVGLVQVCLRCIAVRAVRGTATDRVMCAMPRACSPRR
jgi:hypothetical protein